MFAGGFREIDIFSNVRNSQYKNSSCGDRAKLFKRSATNFPLPSVDRQTNILCRAGSEKRQEPFSIVDEFELLADSSIRRSRKMECELDVFFCKYRGNFINSFANYIEILMIRQSVGRRRDSQEPLFGFDTFSNLNRSVQLRKSRRVGRIVIIQIDWCFA